MIASGRMCLASSLPKELVKRVKIALFITTLPAWAGVEERELAASATEVVPRPTTEAWGK